jgi:hypothetical protein
MPSVEGIIADWEGENAWACYGDGTGSSVRSEMDVDVAHGGNVSLRITYEIVPDGWGDCGTSFERGGNWSSGNGLGMWLRAEAAGQPVELVLFSGIEDAPTPFITRFKTTDESVSSWMHVILPWDRFARAEWADEGGPAELDPGRITGIGLNFVPGRGTLWVDDIVLLTGEPASSELPPTSAPVQASPSPATPTVGMEKAPASTPTLAGEVETGQSGRRLCASAAALPLLAAFAWGWKRR